MAKSTVRIRAAALIVASLVSGCSRTGGVAADSCPKVEFGVFHQQQSSGTRSVRGPEGQIIFLERTPIARLQDISQALVGDDGATVLVSFKPAASDRLRRATTGNSGVRLALAVGDDAPIAVVWEGNYGIEDGRMQLSLQSEETARELVRTIDRCMEGIDD